MNLSLKYLIREPKVIREKNPLLLLIHGYGSNEADLFAFADELPDDYFIVSARAPFDMQYGSYAWYAINFDADENRFSDIEQAKSSRDLIVKFIDELLESYPIDSQKVTLVGFSQGSILSYAIALSHPEKIDKIATLSGYINPDMATSTFMQNDFSKLKVFASHGSVDQVIPVEWARKVKPFLDSFNIANEYHEYPVGHGVAPQNFMDFKQWLLRNA